MDIERLNDAFNNFTKASKSLENYYDILRERVCYLTDELERKNIELNAALEDAEKNKDYLNAILFNLEEAIVVVDPDNNVVMMNKSAENLLAISANDASGKLFAGLDFSIVREVSDTYLTVKDRRYSVFLSQSPIVDSEGCVRGNVILIKDITRLRELEVQHERNQRLIAMGEMAAKIVHEIRNPLCSIELFSSMIEKEVADNALKELAQGVSTGIRNLNNILTNMLFFARPHKAVMNSVQLSRVIEDTTLMFKPLTEARNILIKREVLDHNISGDGELLKQVLMNILINAVQSMPEGGEVGIATREDCGSVVVDVKDRGTGIKEENMERIFDPFFSTKDSGTGLGLAIASKIMQAHGGYIKVDSKEGMGSTFSIYFPITENKRRVENEAYTCC